MNRKNGMIPIAFGALLSAAAVSACAAAGGGEEAGPGLLPSANAQTAPVADRRIESCRIDSRMVTRPMIAAALRAVA